MTRSAKGTLEQPGRNVAAKRSLTKRQRLGRRSLQSIHDIRRSRVRGAGIEQRRVAGKGALRALRVASKSTPTLMRCW